LINNLFLVVSHHYGTAGRDSKKIESKGLLLDFELFRHMSTDHFIESLTDNIKQFVKQLNENVPAGKMLRLLRKKKIFITNNFQKLLNTLKIHLFQM
jgi:hypothetical protein